ncbi:MAG TPA: ABC transporter ATP-binding protein [Flavobacterium sp.]|mgnify:CR=1 FL=1|jgi:ABC-type sulfate/molybdate transport systems ATPase subunit|nr:ABC transporter ATP-binding protein [Flavobacterium sp.]HPJ09046.1 ABC transporter ATP-binding protein [Flavobacterium sp.]
MLDINNISFSYADKPTLQRLSFSIGKGKTLAIIGESGCGKSTLIKLIYGIYDLDQGSISYNNQIIRGPKFKLIPGEDFVKYLAQDFDLMPYITVAENVGQFLSNTNPRKKQARITELLEMVEMASFANVKAQFLSGGQMQRVAIARVLALEPELILLDEPFSHIDHFRRNSLSRKLFTYLSAQSVTCVFATHDSNDVLSFADEVLVMKDGKIVQKGQPDVVFANPKNKYVGSLFGDVNEIPSHLLVNPSDEKIRLVYPFQLQITSKSPLKVTVKQSYSRGNHYLIEAVYEHGLLYFNHQSELPKNALVYLRYTPNI